MATANAPAAAGAACHAVFNTAELAEQIFLELPMQTLLVGVQRTCTQCRDVVRDSKKLQQALFFEPITHHRLQVKDPHPDHIKTTSERITSDQKIYGNPVISDSFKSAEKLQYLGASWRRQLMSQPPVTKFDFLWSEHIITGQDGPIKMGDPEAACGEGFEEGCLDVTRFMRWSTLNWKDEASYYEIVPAKEETFDGTSGSWAPWTHVEEASNDDDSMDT